MGKQLAQSKDILKRVGFQDEITLIPVEKVLKALNNVDFKKIIPFLKYKSTTDYSGNSIPSDIRDWLIYFDEIKNNRIISNRQNNTWCTWTCEKILLMKHIMREGFIGSPSNRIPRILKRFVLVLGEAKLNDCSVPTLNKFSKRYWKERQNFEKECELNRISISG